ncbi:hypothetical protein L7F22_004979 [Adiantum nelumboides]|nr:hypothetical protein [Adiantum nelumboides]
MDTCYNGELTLEDLPLEWLAHCENGEQGSVNDLEQLSLDSFCCDSAYLHLPAPHQSNNCAADQYNAAGGQSALSSDSAVYDDYIENLQPQQLDDEMSYNEFLYAFSSSPFPSPSPSPHASCFSDHRPLPSCTIPSHDSHERSADADTHPIPLPTIKVGKSKKSPKKRYRSYSSTLDSSNKKNQISSPVSVLDYPLDQPHCADGSSLGCEPPPKSSSTHKHSKKFSTSHSGTHLSKDSKWATQLLKACASAIANNNISRTQHLMWVINDLASFTGDANQRLAACGLKALFSRVTGVESLHPSLQSASELDSNNLALSHQRALLKFQDASPWHKCSYTIANGAIVEACEGHAKIHLVDIGVSQGTQWPTLIEALATRASGAPKLLKLTMVHNHGGFENFVSRLEPFAKRLGLNLKLTNIITPLESLGQEDLELEEEEELIVCLQFRVHCLSQENTSETDASTPNKRDKFLRFIHSLNPGTFILSENDVDHCSPDFFTRFSKALEFHWSFLDSTSSSFLGQDSEERQFMEAEAALAFTNVVAFEDNSRIERNETHRAWNARVRQVGFSSYLPGAQVLENAKYLLRKHSGDWNMLVEDGTMVLKWKGNPANFCSIWKPLSSGI